MEVWSATAMQSMKKNAEGMLERWRMLCKVFLAAQPDFQSQLRRVGEEIKTRCHCAIFVPNPHCKLSPIKHYVLGASKDTLKPIETIQRKVSVRIP
jgi:hypothetical protein